MRFFKQPGAIDILNIEEQEHAGNKKHGDLLLNTIRTVISGPSNCGKTTSLFSLITAENSLRFENIYVYSKSWNQLKYRYLDIYNNTFLEGGTIKQTVFISARVTLKSRNI